MLYLICYDVSTETREGRRRLRRIAQACEDYGVRVQKSIFECKVNEREWVLLRARLMQEIEVREDSLRIYPMDEAVKKRIEHHGVAEPRNLEEALIV